MKISRAHTRTVVVHALALLMLMTSMASAMGQMRGAAVGEMVLCTGTGAVVVLVDADGQPVKAQVTCPDCMISAALAGAAAPTVEYSADHALAAVEMPVRVASLARLRADAHRTRAPPLA
ncbi:hypothetical protein ACFE33_04015 [Falsihalocynthiibacter sp. SS001]|uniref:hypothetical protein n=1 Tax=Falsihalocynthiibacter sp. SS001 TaxID=3349698 RepID=UPI0036D3D22D